MLLKEHLKNDTYFKNLNTKHLMNIAKHFDIEIKDLKHNKKFRINVRKRFLENLD